MERSEIECLSDGEIDPERSAGTSQEAEGAGDEGLDAPDDEGQVSLWSLVKGDIRRGVALAVLALGLVAVVELLVTLWVAPPPVRLPTVLRLAALNVTLWAFFGLLFVPLVAFAVGGARLLLALVSPERGRRYAGLLVPRAAALGPPSALPGWIFAVLLVLPAYLAVSAYATVRLWPHYHAKQLLGLMLAALQVALFVGLGLVAVILAYLLRRGGRALHGRLGRWNPLGRVPAALALLGILGVPAVLIALRVMPDLALVLPWRWILAVGVLFLGLVLGARFLQWRGGLMPRAPRARRLAWAVTIPGGLLFSFASLMYWGADPEAKLLAVTSSPPLHSLVDGVRWANDFDRDGYGTLLGENDCAPFDPTIHPGARDIPDDGIDQNCDGRDFSLKRAPRYQRGQRMEVPEGHRRDWNILFLTIDNVRYDHTGFGGYQEKSGRETTPFLDGLVEKSTSFTFANTPAPGTVAAVPAFLTSKFFHSGIALSGERPGKPPKLLSENVLIGEVMKRGSYTTGAILTHEYFNDWGMEQGFDTYDNEIGAKRDPYGVTSPRLTRKAISWLARNANKKWFLWLHYLDPHGRYVAHPGEKSFGTTEKDLYDGELWFTDKWVRTLLEELWRMPGGNRTIVVITSDHGDGFGEHGKINHGWGLHRELLHVPLVFYIPDLPPRKVDGAVSPLDVLPTVADLAGIDVSDLSFEGESLVPQLFYGQDAHHRVVFSETNYPYVQRSATTSRYKLIHNMKANLYQLFCLKTDPWEHKNIYQTQPEVAAKMRGYLNDWMERVFYADDILTNQAAAVRKWHRMTTPPRPQRSASLSFGDGALEVLGSDVKPPRPRAGDEVEVTIYFRVKRPVTEHFSFRVSAWPLAEGGLGRGAISYSPTMPPANGLFPTTRWKVGDTLRDRFKVRLRREWNTAEVGFGLEVFGRTKPRYVFEGAEGKGRLSVGELGSTPLSAASAPPRPPPPATSEGKPHGAGKRRGGGCRCEGAPIPGAASGDSGLSGPLGLLGFLGLLAFLALRGRCTRRRVRRSQPPSASGRLSGP